jgi:polar amino acid transport system substrate-binding protein
VLEQSISVEPIALGIRKGERALKLAVDDTLRELEKSGEAEKLFFKWYGPQTRLKFPKRTFRIDSDQVTS